MKIAYDREVDALYIRFKETTVTTKHRPRVSWQTMTPMAVWRALKSWTR